MRAALACALLLVAAPAAAQDATFDYLHVEANEGSSSGGHVAIRFGDETYHFQHHPGGLLRLHRDDYAAFVHQYTRLENRALHVRTVAVDADVRERLRRRFADRFLLEEAQHARLAALERDRDVLAVLSDGGAPDVIVRGARFFAGDAAAPELGQGPDAAADAIAAVTHAIATNDPRLLGARRADVDRELGALAAAYTRPAAADEPSRLDPHRFAATPPSFVERATELIEASLALDVLRGRATLRREALRDDGGDLLLLGDAERAALRALDDDLRERAVALAASPRPDWGRTLLLTLARLGAVAESLARGRLVVLDAYPADAPALAPDEVRAQASVVPALLRETGAELAEMRRSLATGRAPRELQYAALEAAVNRQLELARASAGRASLRLSRGALVASGDAPMPLQAAAVAADRDALVLARDAAARRADAYAAAMHARYGYDLLTRNCVSELLREIADALATPGQDDQAGTGDRVDCSGSSAALGGCVDPTSRLRFIPFVSADAVDDEYRVVARTDVPSFRQQELDRLSERDGSLTALLREVTVPGSTLYTPRDEDSVFLFFTDDLPLARPLLGAANLATGLGAAAAGLVVAPADDGTLLVRGLRGALFSVPELGFVSLRKGSFAWAPRTAEQAP
ncbi:MAG: hypothetical protein U0842_12420 [Candidatus Binatia bacterium]